MPTVTAHTLFSRAARYSAGATSLGCPKPAVVSLPYARNSGKKTPRSLCYYADPRSIDHPSNIPPVALVHPIHTVTDGWKIKDDDKKVELTFFNMPAEAKKEDFLVAFEGNVLVIRKPPADQPQPHDDILFHVRLLVPDWYDKEKIKAKLKDRNLVVVIPKFPKPADGLYSMKPFCKKVDVEEKP